MTGKNGGARDLKEILRDEFVQRDRIAAALQGGPKTLPELATALDAPVHEVTLWVMGMRRYGRIHEVPKGREEDYYRYELTAEPS